MNHPGRSRFARKQVEDIREILRRQAHLGIIRCGILLGGSNGILGCMTRCDELNLTEEAIIGQVEYQDN